MVNEKVGRLEAFLATQNANVETISKARIKQLEKADEAIQKRLETIEEARKNIKDSVINVSSISADTGISRKTFYNNDLLRLYVERYATTEEEEQLEIECNKLKEKNAELLQQVRDFVSRDIAAEKLKHENAELQKEIENLQKRNTYLEDYTEELQIKINNLEEGRILHFPENKK